MATYEAEFKFPDEQAEEKEEKLSVEIEDDTPEEDRGRKSAGPIEDPSDDELSKYSKDVRERVGKLKRGYHDERRAKEQAERERQAAEEFARQVYEENKRLKGQLKTGSEVFIEQNKSSAQMELDAAKKAYKEAYESGDADGVAEAQAAMTKAALRIDRAEQMRPIDEPEVAPPVVKQKSNVTPRTQEWIDDNSKWFGVDDEMTMAAMGLDKKLKTQYGDGYAGTEEYFRTIDKTMRKRFPEHFDDVQSHEVDDTSNKSSDPEEEPPRRAKPASVVAPASRSTPPTRVKLTASQAAIARRLGVPIEDYAKQVANLRRNG